MFGRDSVICCNHPAVPAFLCARRDHHVLTTSASWARCSTGPSGPPRHR
ncbi:Hypothetical protein A7982_06180 [Minicystis rosea]|nr:Hypothetical protein A7982_06180 [Minicystis rosea]